MTGSEIAIKVEVGRTWLCNCVPSVLLGLFFPSEYLNATAVTGVVANNHSMLTEPLPSQHGFRNTKVA